MAFVRPSEPLPLSVDVWSSRAARLAAGSLPLAAPLRFACAVVRLALACCLFLGPLRATVSLGVDSANFLVGLFATRLLSFSAFFAFLSDVDLALLAGLVMPPRVGLDRALSLAACCGGASTLEQSRLNACEPASSCSLT